MNFQGEDLFNEKHMAIKHNRRKQVLIGSWILRLAKQITQELQLKRLLNQDNR